MTLLTTEGCCLEGKAESHGEFRSLLGRPTTSTQIAQAFAQIGRFFPLAQRNVCQPECSKLLTLQRAPICAHSELSERLSCFQCLT